ncbi:MAG: pilus assembly protein PilM [Verrucomicrobia bacterium]|nr:pilus assembly protein PilM [Verrucomicrobiota bacterium]
MQTVSLAEFKALPNGGLKLLAFRKSDLIVDPSADATRPMQIETVVKELRTALKIRAGTRVHVTLPSQSVFSRFVKLPGTNPEDVTSIITFEAQQNVPFPIDDVIWDYQIMGPSRDNIWDVALLAIKADSLSEIADSISKGGLNAWTIDVAPAAIYNAFRYNYPNASGCSLLIDIGSRTTNLIFCEGDRMYSRSIPIAGNSISSAIAKEFNQDITLAERLKIEKGSIGLGGAYAEPEDPASAKIAKVTRNTMTRLHAEIARSINFYRTTQGGSSLLRVYLCGGSTALPYTMEFFTEKLQVPVDFFHPIKNVMATEESVAQTTGICSGGLGELVGSALRSLKNCPLEMSLRAPSAIRAQDMGRRAPKLVMSAILVTLMPLLWFIYFTKASKVLDDTLSKSQKDTSALKTLSANIDKITAEQKALVAETLPFLVKAQERSTWTEILEELADKIPTRFIWITQLKPVIGTLTPPEDPAKPAAPKGAPTPAPQPPVPAITGVEVNGLYLDNPPNEKGALVIDDFYDKLKAAADHAAGEKIAYPFSMGEDKSKIITQRTTPTGENWAYGYTLVLPLAQPIVLP